MDKSQNGKVHIELIKRLDVYEPTTNQDRITSVLNASNFHDSIRYGKSESYDAKDIHYNHFPILINSDGTLWTEANRYLLSRIDNVVPAKHRTLETLALDLMHFRQWLTDESIDFLHVTPKARFRPTYRYCAYLHTQIQLLKLKQSTAKRKMSTVQGFYRWLDEDGYKFEYPLWIESDAKFFFTNSQGFTRGKSIYSTDLSRTFKNVNNGHDYSNRIEDGGRLRPLPKNEQISLIESLKRVGNIEMLLSFIFAITTGARLQTVFTLRKVHFSQKISDDDGNYRLKVGNGTLVNTKNGKQNVLLVPFWLYRKFQTYLNSDRYFSRLERSDYQNQIENQYAFLTKAGKPYYMASQDEYAVLYRSPPRGNAVTQFIRQQLKPDLLANGHDFEISFHDLRATFGMNLLEKKLLDYKSGAEPKANQPEFFQLLMYVRERMGHTHLRTTEAYLNYRQKYHLALDVQNKYELYLEKLINQERVDIELD